MHQSILILCISMIGLAQTQANDLYEGRVLIEENHEINSQESFKQALTQVLIKLSGNSKQPLQPMVQEHLKEIDRLVENYTYQVLSERGQRMLVVHFDKTKTNEMLFKLGLPHWRSHVPPPLLGWVGLETDFLTENTSSQEATLLKNQAQQRGITLFFPLFDIEDISTLKPSDIHPKIKPAVTKIMQRYGIPTVLVGWIFKALNQWQSQWYLYVNDEEIFFNQTHTQLSLLLTEAIKRTIDEMAKRFSEAAPVTIPDEAFEFFVADLPSLQEYTQVHDYLKKMPIITELQVLSIQRGHAKFRASVEGGRKAFLQAIAMGKVLVLHKEEEMRFRFNQAP